MHFFHFHRGYYIWCLCDTPVEHRVESLLVKQPLFTSHWHQYCTTAPMQSTPRPPTTRCLPADRLSRAPCNSITNGGLASDPDTPRIQFALRHWRNRSTTVSSDVSRWDAAWNWTLSLPCFSCRTRHTSGMWWAARTARICVFWLIWQWEETGGGGGSAIKWAERGRIYNAESYTLCANGLSILIRSYGRMTVTSKSLLAVAFRADVLDTGLTFNVLHHLCQVVQL